jgi:hypothetical protein
MRFATCFRTLPVLVLALAGSASLIRAAEIASATMSSALLSPGNWQYNLQLDDTGTTDLGTFWFSWVPGEDFMPTSPASVTSAAGWNETVTSGGAGDGYAIQWVAGGGFALTPGESVAGFSFDSATSPTTMAGASPFHSSEQILTSFVYIGAPLTDPGFQFQVTQVAAATPEPATAALAFVCGGILIVMQRIRRKRLAGRIS